MASRSGQVGSAYCVFTLKSYQTHPVKIGESRDTLTSRLEADLEVDLEVSLPFVCLL